VFVILGIIAARSAYPAAVTINSGLVWKDVSGNVIQAHGGCVIKVDSIFYWYGENRSTSGASQAVTCYSSTDLKN
jgi:hypothetical protein